LGLELNVAYVLAAIIAAATSVVIWIHGDKLAKK
jgi:hypothetical protein